MGLVLVIRMTANANYEIQTLDYIWAQSTFTIPLLVELIKFDMVEKTDRN
jgi:hypothetical protein